MNLLGCVYMWPLQMSMFLGEVLPGAHDPPNVMTHLLPEAARTLSSNSQLSSQLKSPKFSKLTGTTGEMEGRKEGRGFWGLSRPNTMPRSVGLKLELG